MTEEKDILDIKGIIRRRKKAFIFLFLFVFIDIAVVALLLPPVYMSKSTILIQEQQIPQEFVQATVTTFAEERLQMITQQIMSRARLLEIINRFNLYEDMRDKYTTEEIVEEMRDDIHFETISAEVKDVKTGRPGEATIAFTLAYEGEKPDVVQAVANVLASLYLEENLRSREEQASSITAFLQQEADSRKREIDEIQNRITRFKQAHLGELPEHAAMNMQSIEQLSRRLDALDTQIRSLQERKILLEGQIANVDPMTPIITENGKAMMNPAERLRALRLELVRLQGTLTDKHPDIRNLKSEIQKLEAQVDVADDPGDKVRRLEDAEGRLASLKGQLGPAHPDVKSLEKEIAALKSDIQAMKAVSQARQENPDNPAYINLSTQISATALEIRSLLNEKNEIRQKMAEYRKKMENSPMVEKEYSELVRAMEAAQLKYSEIMSKLMESKVAQEMEATQRGEKFTIIDPAQLPEKPYKPNRIAIILVGFVLAVGAGVGLAAIKESVDTSIKSAEQFGSFTRVPVLSVLPLVISDEEKRAHRIKWAAATAAAILVIVIGLYVFNEYVMPLDVFWAKLQRRMVI